MGLWHNENRTSFLIIISVLLLVSLLWFAFETPALNPRLEKEKYLIEQKWDLPKDLNEISAITWIGENKLACVQDEQGIVFIYNLDSMKIEQKINFEKAGDYEAIALMDKTIYVLQSDGKIFEIDDYTKADFKVTTHSTPFSEKNNMESMTADVRNNRLLLMPKDEDLHSKDKMGIYAFDLSTKTLSTKPIMIVDLKDPIFLSKEKDDDDHTHQRFYPAGIAIHPKDGTIYIVEGKKPKLLQLDSTGDPLILRELRKKKFNQPEGITFSPDGTLFISNEDKKAGGNILQVELD